MTELKTNSAPRRLLALLLAVAFLMGFATPVAAADEYPVPYPDLKVTHTKNGAEWGALNDEKTAWGVTVYGRSATGSYQPVIIFTNVGEEEKTLSFDLTAEFGEGAKNAYVQVATGTSGGTNLVYETASFNERHVECNLAPNGVVRVVAKSSIGTDIPLTVTLTNLKFIKPNVTVTTTFLAPENGSYTVNGATVTVEESFSNDASFGYNVVATPAEGYRFYAWYERNTDRILSTAALTTLSLDSDSVVSALFVPDVAEGEGVFGVEMSTGAVPFADFADAADFAVAMRRPQITLLKDYTLTESITIPGGVTLLVPFDNAHTIYTTEPEIDTKTVLLVTTPAAHVTPSAFRTLTMAEGSSITIEEGGGLSLSSKISASGTGANSYNGTPTGPDGRIVMQGSSSIEIENGGSLYAYGFISGSGSVHAASGASVYECFQIRNWRGGNATLGLASSDVFPVSMYYVQNIEVPLTLDAGAKEIARSAVNASSTAMGAGVTFIGEGGMFNVTEGSVTKEYVPASDRLEITLDGDASVTSIQLKIPEMGTMLPEGIDSANFALPINNNITVNCASGSEVMIDQDMALLPGAVLNVEAGAEVTLGNDTEVYVYDRDDYVGKGYVAGHDGDNSVNFIPVGYSASNGTNAIRSDGDLLDARINVNGTVIVNGGLYTTTAGAAIVSEGKTGKIIFRNGTQTNVDTHMATQSGNVASVVDVPVTNAKLQNGDGSYLTTTDAEANDEYIYSDIQDRWIAPFHGITITFDANGGEGEMEPIEIPYDVADQEVALPECLFTRTGYEFVGWSDEPDCAIEDVSLYEYDEINPSNYETNRITFYAIWERQAASYTVTFNANGGEGEMAPQRFEEGVQQALSMNAFTRAGYDFIGWAESPDGGMVFTDGQVTAIEENLNLYAIWQKNYNTLTFHSNYDPDQTVTQDFPINADTVTLNPNTFTREGYVFLGWAFEPDAVSAALPDGATLGFDEDTDLYAVWEKNTFTITFDANGGEGEMAPQTIVREESTPLTLNQFTREGYDFIGWATEPNGQIWFADGESIMTDAIEDFTLYAQWQIREYTVEFKNYDGVLLQSFTIEHGHVPEYTGSAFGRDADAQFSYTFAGWNDGETTYAPDAALPAATKNVTYTATYTAVGNWYDVTITTVGTGTVNSSADPVMVNDKAEYGAELTLTAIGIDGWIFSCWKGEDGSIVSNENPYITTVQGDVNLKAVFVPDPDAVAKIGDKYYSTLNAAVADSVNGDVIVLLKNWTQTEDVTIPEGVALLLPYAAGQEEIYPDIDLSGIDFNNPDIVELMYRLRYYPFANETHGSTVLGITPIGEQVNVKLTLATGVVMTVANGASLVVGGTMTGNQPVTGTVYGSHSEIELNQGAEIVIEHGAMLSNCGYIYGAGQIEAHGTVYEPFVITDYHGGSALLGRITKNRTPFNSFALMNVQCDLVIHDDAAMKGYAMVNVSGTQFVCASALVVGKISDDEKGMFVLGDGATLTISYDSESPTDTYGIPVGKSTFTARGDIQFLPFSLNLGMTLPTDGITFGIPYNIDMVQESGCFTIASKAAILSGSTVTIKEGASAVVKNGSELLVLDYFNPGNDGGKPTYPDSETMKRGNLFVDGTLTIESGATFGGVVQTHRNDTARVIVDPNAILGGTFTACSGEGYAFAVDARIALPAADNSNCIFNIADIGAAEYIAFSNDQVADEDGNEQTPTRGVWTYEVEVSFLPNAADAVGTTAAVTAIIGAPMTMPECGFTREGYIFMGWNTMANGNGTNYAAGYSVTLDSYFATTYFATWAPDGWVRDDTGLLYYQNGAPLKTGWTKLGENWYYFNTETGYAATGYAMVPYAPAETGHIYGPYEVDLLPEAGHPEYAELGYATNGEFVFDENGVFQINRTGKIMKNGSEWWCQNGEIIWHARLVTDGEYYYYGSAGGSLKRSVTCGIGDTNGLLPAGTYTFDDEGRIIMYNGIITLEDGKWYYENGRRTYRGLFEEPEESGVYYYAASDGRIICGQDYYVTKTNDLFDAGIYTFDAEGMMILNGLFWQNGKLWYYENGVKTYAGLIKVGGDYYYIRTNGSAVLDSDYYVSKTNGLMDKGVYHFGPDGKMVIPETSVKDGLIWEDGKLWYYENGVRTHAGLILVDGYYYYIKSNGQAVTDCDYFVSNTNDLMPRATHHFDENGRMTDVHEDKNGLVEEGGKLVYYVDGVRTHAGLILIDGNYYYIKSDCTAVRDCDYFVSNTNGLLPIGTYHFNADATMVVDP